LQRLLQDEDPEVRRAAEERLAAEPAPSKS